MQQVNKIHIILLCGVLVAIINGCRWVPGFKHLKESAIFAHCENITRISKCHYQKFISSLLQI
jgi:hypothetical protein